MKYSQRPTVVDAEQYFSGADQGIVAEQSAFLTRALQRCECGEKAACAYCGRVYVLTSSGPKVVEEGDYVVLEAGVYSVLKPEQFVEIYKKEH